jgi:hypothetical protein
MNAPAKYTKKPVTIEAVRWTGDNYETIRDWVGERSSEDPYNRNGFIPVEEQWPDPPEDITALVWDRLHSTWVGVKTGHWIIKGIQGEFYPCDNEVFWQTYWKMEENA